MERFLTKPRVLCALCAVLLIAALNRQDPMVYGMFLMLSAVAILGYAWPWLSLRSLGLETASSWPARRELQEGEALDLGLRLRQSAWWPAWVVEVVAAWEWAGRRFESRSSVVLVSRGRAAPVLDGVLFPCRGRFVLRSLQMRSGFPLGLVHAEGAVGAAALEVLVHPRP